MERQAFIDAVAQHQDMVYRVALHWFGDPPGRGETPYRRYFCGCIQRKSPSAGRSTCAAGCSE